MTLLAYLFLTAGLSALAGLVWLFFTTREDRVTETPTPPPGPVLDACGRTRRDHVRWCKEFARESLNRGDAIGAILDMVRELPKHPATANMPWMEHLAAAAMRQRTLEAAREFVEGFAE